MRKKLTTEEFIKRAREVHTDKYDYSKSIFINTQTKIVIICPIHGEFKQLSYPHLHGVGCPECFNQRRGGKKNNKHFIQKAREVHGDKYDYSKVDYVNAHTKVIILCPEHGEFEQVAYYHLNGNGCSKCCHGNSLITEEEFIERARAVHGDKYDYSKVDYRGNKTKIIINCPEHGEFEMKPNSHVSGKQNCPVCSEKRLVKEMSLDELKKIIKPFKIKTQREYQKWWMENKEFCRKNGIPANPADYYSK